MNNLKIKDDEKIIYYKDEQNDDFAGNNIEKKPLGDDFKYVHTNIVYRIQILQQRAGSM